MNKDDGIHIEELRQFRGIILTSPDGEHIMMQFTEFGVVKGAPVTFNEEESRRLCGWLMEVLFDV